MFIDKTLRLNNLKARTAMNAQISVSVSCVEIIIYLLLYNLRDCIFKFPKQLENKNSTLTINVWNKFL